MKTKYKTPWRIGKIPGSRVIYDSENNKIGVMATHELAKFVAKKISAKRVKP